MVKLKELTDYLDNRLKIADIPGDHSNNGLQVEGVSKVKKAIFGVDASLEIFERASAENADFIFVHHGLSWGSQPKRFTGVDGKRLSTLFKSGISLYAAHLPLDAHAEIGHNALLANMLDLNSIKSFCEYDGAKIGMSGTLPVTKTSCEIAAVYEKKLDCKAQIFNDTGKKIGSVGIVSGGGGLDGLYSTANGGYDCYITGEFNHTMWHHAKETGVSVIVLGHYKSETPGVLAVMKELSEKFSVETAFADIPTGL